MKRLLYIVLLVVGLFTCAHARSRGPVCGCAYEKGQQAYCCIKRQAEEPWYYDMPQNWYGPGEWFAGPMNRKYYGGPNAFPSPGRWIGAQW
jgi:hypothetical protein